MSEIDQFGIAVAFDLCQSSNVTQVFSASFIQRYHFMSPSLPNRQPDGSVI
ncbi:hypothetical protein FY133_27045 (plasmid) [Agrobacterium tumefaciens]|uniref:Uncharacterized protein n=1 Tax=Agrobacterium vitis TaxID=373 RepID=A0AAE2UQ79_AGRVI|nr:MULTISPECIES: hypothetical protein [Agrobacterium]MBF2712728.1 hypothetical protein [Agrobacterium vitis]MUO42953.1 hypothetical protein [Agrobacterium vitis]NSZ19978.1 hypothetical protein [Agrobacterium vitis]QZO07024.1 hypothetical protein K4831_23385 [Agrobacterium vitis]UJL91283.1 hypothetical protein AVF2S5_25225 [Agrobacterium vitis]